MNTPRKNIPFNHTLKSLKAGSAKWPSNIKTLWSYGLRSSMKKPEPPPRTPTAQPVELPFDVISQVLARLPAKSLCRFKCVCKLWKSTISDPRFIESCRMGSQFWLGGNYLAIFWFYRDEIVINFEHHDDGIRRHKVPPPLKFKLNRSVDGRGLEISSPLNGLVCLYSRKVRHAFILNIKTRQIINLPEISEDCGTVTLCCDQLTGEYKVLQFYRTFDPAPRLESAIYTLNGLDSDSSWRKTVFRTLRFTETPTYNANVLVVGSEWSACFPIICPHFVANGFVPTEIWVLEECWGFNEVSIKEKIPLPRDFTLESHWRHVYSGELPTGELFIVDSRTTRKFYVDLKKKRYEIKWSYPRQGKYLTPYPHKVLIGYVENMYRFEDHDNGRHRVTSFLRED